jgi:translation elongation factor EF-G
MEERLGARVIPIQLPIGSEGDFEGIVDLVEMNAKVWRGETLDDEEAARVLALFTFTLPDHPRLEAGKRGAAGFAVLGSSADRFVRIKPQNLIAGLPLAVGE